MRAPHKPTDPKKADLARGFTQPTKALPIKRLPDAIKSNAMAGLRNPLSQTPKKRQSVDGRIGAEAAAEVKVPPKAKAKPARGLMNR